MAINKVVLGNDTLLDLTADTVAPEHLAQGYTAHDAAGNAIVGTMTGGSGGYVPTNEELTFKDSVARLFSYNRWNWVIDNYGNRITTTNLSDVSGIFRFSTKLRTIPFDINFKSSAYAEDMFYYCYSLRNLSKSILSKLHNEGKDLAVYKVYNGLFTNCYALDEINGLAVDAYQMDDNMFKSTFVECGRLKNIIFETTNGVAKTAEWRNQVIDLSYCVGYLSRDSKITDYNSGITIDKKVTDATTYTNLKNDPDWWTIDVNYSRYNHDSAVLTLNSLPDTSSFVTSSTINTIKFNSTSGTSTDGGAISNLTEEEIAVATVKGWSVAYA